MDKPLIDNERRREDTGEIPVIMGRAVHIRGACRSVSILSDFADDDLATLEAHAVRLFKRVRKIEEE